MRQSNNVKLHGGGIHHIALQATDFDRSVRFYTDGLGFQPVLQFQEGKRVVAMLNTGNGVYLELFSDGPGTPTAGPLMHWALRTDDCDAAVARARATGATITQEPTDVQLGDPVVAVRYAFCTGPDGEEIEFLQSAQI